MSAIERVLRALRMSHQAPELAVVRDPSEVEGSGLGA